MDSKFESIFKARFALFKSEKPDHTGTMELTLPDAMALAEYITSQPGEENYRGDKVIKIPIKAWNKQTQSGKDWISGLMSVDKQMEEDKSDSPF